MPDGIAAGAQQREFAAMSGKDEVERFSATNGRITGVLTVVVCAVMAGAGVVEGPDNFAPWVTGMFVVVGVLAWASMLRPALWVTSTDLVMRGMVTTLSLPLAGIEELALRQMLAVRVGDKRYVSSVVGRSWRRLVVRPRPGKEPKSAEVDYPTYVEDRIRDLAIQARERAGIRRGSAEQVALRAQRSIDLAPIAALGAGVVLLIFTALV